MRGMRGFPIMNGMSRWRMGLIIALAAAFGIVGWRLYKEHSSFRASVEELRAKSVSLEEENSGLFGKIEYFGIPENLLKEARARFNFTRQGEKLLIVIPQERAATSSNQKQD